MSRFLVDVVVEIDVDRIGRGTLAVSVIEKLAVPVVDMTTGRLSTSRTCFSNRRRTVSRPIRGVDLMGRTVPFQAYRNTRTGGMKSRRAKIMLADTKSGDWAAAVGS